MNFEVYLVGGIDFLAPIFKGLVILLGGSAIASFVKLNVLLGAVFVIWMSLFGRDKFFFAKYFIMAIIVLNLFFSPIATLTIIDTKYQKTEVVHNFPFGPAFIISLASNTSDFLTQAIDNIFHSGTTVVWDGANGSYVTDLDYRNNGFAGAFFKMTKLLSSDFKNSPEYSDLFEMTFAYMEQCFIPHLLSEKVNNPANYRQLLKEPDLYGSGKLRVQGFLIEWQNNVYSCNNFYDNILSPKIQNFKNAIQNKPELAGFNFYDTLNIDGIVQTLTLANYNFSTAVSQAALINTLRYVISAKSVDTYNILSAYIAGKVLEKQKLSFLALGKYASKLLPTIRNYLIALAVFFSFMLIPLILIPSLGGLSPGLPIWGFARFIIWTFMWDPMLALLDAGMKIYAIQKTTSWLTQNQVSGISILTHTSLWDDMSFYPAVAGYIGAVMVPSLAWMFVKGFEATASAISYMFSSASAAVSAEAQNIGRTIEREKFARMVGFRNAGELDYLGSMYNAMYESTQIKSHFDYETTRSTKNMLWGLYTKSSVELERQIGEAKGYKEFAEKYFGGNVEEASEYLQEMGTTQNYGNLRAFAQYLERFGLNKYIDTRLLELMNETAKMKTYNAMARLLGYKEVYDFMLSKHGAGPVKITIDNQNRQEVADLFERMGFRKIANEIRTGKHDGAILEFTITKGNNGNFAFGNVVKLEKGGKVEIFHIWERRNAVINEDIAQNTRLVSYTNKSEIDLGNIFALSPETATQKLLDSLYNFLEAYGATDKAGNVLDKEKLKYALEAWGQGTYEVLKESAETFLQRGRSEETSKRWTTELSFGGGQDLAKFITKLKKNPKAQEILTSMGFSSAQIEALLEGNYNILTSVDNKTYRNFVAYYLKDKIDEMIGDILSLAEDGRLTRKEIQPKVAKLEHSIRGMIDSNRDFGEVDAFSLGKKHFSKVLDDKPALGLAALYFTIANSPVLVQGGSKFIQAIRNWLKKDGGEAVRELSEFGEGTLSGAKRLLGRKTAAKYVDDFAKAVIRTAQILKISPTEAIEYAKHEFVRLLAGKGVPADKAEKMFEEISVAFRKASTQVAKETGIFARIARGLGKVAGPLSLLSEFVMPEQLGYDEITPEMQKQLIRQNLQNLTPETMGLDVQEGHFVIKDPDRFKKFVDAIGLSQEDYDLQTRMLTLRGEEKIIEFFNRINRRY